MLVLEIFQLLLHIEPRVLPGQMANELFRGDRDLMGFSFTAHSVSQGATCVATLVYTFTFKERHMSCSPSHLDGTKQSLTKGRKCRPCAPIPGETHLSLTVFSEVLWLCL